MKSIPTLEDASPEYAGLQRRHGELMARAEIIASETRELHASIGTEQATSRHIDRVAALLTGVDYTPPLPIKDRLAALATEARAIDDAIRELSGHIALERQATSRLVVAGFETERQRMAAEFFTHIAAAAKVHAAYGEARRGFHRAGIDPAGFSDFGIELFGDAGHRNADVGVAMRAAVRRGYLKESQLPEAYR